MKYAIVVATAHNGVIGKDNTLPWHISEDLQYFKRLTAGHAVIMGRKCFEAVTTQLKKPLPNRHNIVLTQQQNYRTSKAVSVVHSIEQALQVAQHPTPGMHTARAFIIGGAAIYRQALPWVSEIYWTRLALTVTGDVFFPVAAGDPNWCEDTQYTQHYTAVDSVSGQRIACTNHRYQRVLATKVV